MNPVLVTKVSKTTEIFHGASSRGKQFGPGTVRSRGQKVGVGVRHALFPGGTRLDALAFAGGVLPDATLRGMRMSRSHGGTVPTVTGRNL